MTVFAQPRNSKARAAQGPISVTPVTVWTGSAVISSAVVRVWPVMEHRRVQQQEPVQRFSMDKIPVSARRSPHRVVVWTAPVMVQVVAHTMIRELNAELQLARGAIFTTLEAVMALVLA